MGATLADHGTEASRQNRAPVDQQPQDALRLKSASHLLIRLRACINEAGMSAKQQHCRHAGDNDGVKALKLIDR